MALIVEDGSIVDGAEAFASITWVAGWMERRNLLAQWNALVSDLAEKEAHAREATAYLGLYTWRGARVGTLQLLDWPRSIAIRAGTTTIAADVVPEAVMDGQAYLMWERARGGPLLPSWSGAPVKRKSAGSGVAKEFGGGGDFPVRHFPELNAILHGLYASAPALGGGGVSRLMRA